MVEAPYAPTAEGELISAVILDPVLIDQYELSSIPPEAFGSNANRIIWNRILEIHLAERLVDLPTLIETMRQAKELDKAGGVTYLMGTMSEAQGVGSNASAYADMVIDAYQRRRLMGILGEGIEDAANNQGFAGVMGRLEASLLTLTPGGNGVSDEDALELATDYITRTGQAATGFTSLDRAIGGFPIGDLTVIAGRTSMGKSAFIHNIAFKLGGLTTVLSPDQPKPEVFAAQASRISRVPLEAIRSGIATDEDKARWSAGLARVRAILNAGLSFQDGPLTLNQATRHIARAARLGHKMVFVDHLQRIRNDSKRRLDRRELMIETTGTLKDLAREFNIAVVALSQLKRDIDERQDKVPLLSDLSESKSIEEDANLVLFLYRQGYYNPSSSNVADIVIGKYKTGARNRSVQLYYEPRFMEFVEISDQITGQRRTSLI